jgi:hypothetical protein
MKHLTLFLMVALTLYNCGDNQNSLSGDQRPQLIDDSDTAFRLSDEEAHRLAQLPLNCIQTEYPNKTGQTLGSKEDLREPHILHPAFYGCFDWHSSVHGHWSLVKLLKMYPDLEDAERIREMLAQNITTTNVADEVAYYEGEHNRTYERTYGWAWLLKLADELRSWNDPLGEELAENLQPLSDKMVMSYMEFLPNLNYPIRVGEHTNTAFGLAFAWDYAISNGIDSLQLLIERKSREFYLGDRNCPLDWEPGGFDFLSPCLEEIDLMRRVLNEDEFLEWMDGFAPQMQSGEFSLETGKVSDRTDGKLVHLDGLNFSRAWVLYGLAHQYPRYAHLIRTADQHIAYSLPFLTDGNYEGEHWLATFAIYALSVQSDQ